MLKKYFVLIILFTLFSFQSCNKEKNSKAEPNKPVAYSSDPEKEKEEHNPDKHASWTPEQAALHQKRLAKLPKNKVLNSNLQSTNPSYANGTLMGEWTNRGPKNMPGAFKFAEMLDGTDTMYAVTYNHYPTEYNSTSYIHKGTVYNPTTGTGGDDFVVLTANWPNRYQNLFAFQNGANVRLVAHIEEGPLYYSDDDGATWTKSAGLPSFNRSSAINRQDNNKIYCTNGRAVYVSTDAGATFNLLKDFGPNAVSHLYTPRYTAQAGSNNVYIARNGSFYKLNATKTDFDLKGDYTTFHFDRNFSIGGDSSKIYVTENNQYWVSTDEGVTWVQKYPLGNWYGNTSGKMSAGRFFAVHPTNPNITLGGYAHPVVSVNGLNSVWTDATGWGWYQNGGNLSTNDYYNKIRFNYHPDFQSSHFFYNSSGTLFSARCSDGGVFVSYKEWTDFPNKGDGYNNTDYANAHYININVLNTINPLIYRNTLFTGKNNPNHIYFGTQDQGSQNIITGTTGNALDFYQSIGGDGPNIDSQDGLHAWHWGGKGNQVLPPVSVYTTTNQFKSIRSINNDFDTSKKLTFTGSTSYMSWSRSYIDRHNPDQNIWLLSRQLNRATWNGNTLSGHVTNLGNNQVAALAQGAIDGNKLFMLQDAKVFTSTDKGNTFNTGIQTPFEVTFNSNGRGDIGSGIVLPGNDNWILFCAPSRNNVGSILSKDGGLTWNDVTGIFPTGFDAQTGGMVASADGNYIFAGTDVGPYVFNVSNETWYSLSNGIGNFNTMDVEYIEAINTVRFASWGSGVLDFKITSTTLSSNNSESIASQDVKIYPNPATNFISVDFNNSNNSPLTVELYTINGQLISSRNYNSVANSPLKINVSDLNSGIYLMKLKTGNNTIKTHKLVIN